jgi:hypothetical protein
MEQAFKARPSLLWRKRLHGSPIPSGCGVPHGGRFGRQRGGGLTAAFFTLWSLATARVFYTKKLDPAQVKYSAFNRELWAYVAGICHFRFNFEGLQFAELPDHKPLTYALICTFEL